MWLAFYFPQYNTMWNFCSLDELQSDILYQSDSLSSCKNYNFIFHNNLPRQSRRCKQEVIYLLSPRLKPFVSLRGTSLRHPEDRGHRTNPPSPTSCHHCPLQP